MGVTEGAADKSRACVHAKSADKYSLSTISEVYSVAYLVFSTMHLTFMFVICFWGYSSFD